MKQFNAVKLGWTGQKEHQSQCPQTAPSAGTAMQTDAPVKKSAGRLSRDDQRRLGDILQRVYDDIVHQGVPDRFRDLLDKLESGGPVQNRAEAAPASEQGSTHADGDEAPPKGAEETTRKASSEPDRVMEARGLPTPGTKGSHQ
jgi:hypothetical protein